MNSWRECAADWDVMVASEESVHKDLENIEPKEENEKLKK